MLKKISIKKFSRLIRKGKERNIMDYVQAHSLVIGVAGVVGVAIILTSINMVLYVTTGTSKLDLSRPGYESARKEVSNEDKLDQQKSFSSIGKLDKKTLDEYLVSYKKKQQALQRYDKFSTEILENPQLNLPSSTEPVQATSSQ